MTIIARLLAGATGLALFVAAGAVEAGCYNGSSSTGRGASWGGGPQYSVATTSIGNVSEVSFSGGTGVVSVHQTSGPTWSYGGGTGGHGGGTIAYAPLNVTIGTPGATGSPGAGGGAVTGASNGGGLVNTGSTSVGGPATVSGGSGGLVNVGNVGSPTSNGGLTVVPVSTGNAPVGVGTGGIGPVGGGTNGVGPVGVGPVGTTGVGAGVGTGAVSGGAKSVSTPTGNASLPLQLCAACVGGLTGGVGG